MQNYSTIMSEDITNKITKYLNGIENGYTDKFLYSVTIKLRRERFYDGILSKTDFISRLYWKFDLFYNQICGKTLGRKYFRKENSLKPMVWVFLESGGAKLSVIPGAIYDLHFHTLWIVDIDQASALYEIANKEQNLIKSYFSSIFIQKLDFTKNDTENIEGVLSYISKYQNMEQKKLQIGDSARFYPREKNA